MRAWIMGVAGALAWVSAANATDVTFSGTLTGVCTLAVPVQGTLGLAADGSLGSSAGLPAVLSILSVGTNTVTVNPPVWVSKAGGYDNTGESLQVAYFGVGGLSLINQDYTPAQTSFGVNTLPVTLLTLNAKATNSSGFPAGSYSMKVVVTCS